MSTDSPPEGVQTAQALVELTKGIDGTWLNVEIGGRKASFSLTNSNHGPMVGGILKDWAESHFKPVGPVKKTFALIVECLLAGVVTLVLAGIIVGALYLCWVNAGNLAQGFGLALGAGVLGGVVHYFKITRRAFHKLTGGRLFKS